MSNKKVIFSNYVIGNSPLDNIENVCIKYGKKILAIGGEKAIDSIKEKLTRAIENTSLEIIDFICYGGECTYENINKISCIAKEKDAEIILGIGGGKAIDTAKGIAENIKKPIIVIPTIASTCAAITSLSVIYKENGDFDSFYFLNSPPDYVFIDSTVIAQAPSKYLRAGIGDTIAKHYECTLASRGDELEHSSAMAREISKMCVGPLLQYGKKALEDCEKDKNTFEVEQVILNNIVSTGFVSLLIEEKYNGAIAHSLFYGFTLLEHIEKNYLHGDVVGYGVLVQLAIDNNIEEAKKLYKFFKEINIPTSLSDIDVENNREYLDKVLQETVIGPDMEHLPYRVTADMVFNGIQMIEGLK